MWARNAGLPRSIQESFTCRKSTTWDRRLYFPSEGRRAKDFFVLKNPTASAGFEPANLGTKGEHATSRPLKPLYVQIYENREGIVHPEGYGYFEVVVGFVWSSDLERYAGGSVATCRDSHVGQVKGDNTEKKSDKLFLQVGGWTRG